MNQRTFLGLTHNPFESPRDGFFPGADRQTHLEHLRHLSQWSRRILAVTGSAGIGKSSLFKELSSNLESGTRGARLSGSVITSEREVVIGLLQGFGIAADFDAHLDDLCLLIGQHAREQSSSDLMCMAMVDDAHLLDSQAVQRLVKLVSQSRMRLVMFAQPDLVADLDRAAKRHGVEWFEIRLTGFPKVNVREYIEWRFQQAENRGRLPFADEQIGKIAAKSHGYPGDVDRLASKLLVEMESGEFQQRGRFPVSHLTLALLVMAAVGLTYLYVRDDIDVPGAILAFVGLDEKGAEVELAPPPDDTRERTAAGPERIFADAAVDQRPDDDAPSGSGPTDSEIVDDSQIDEVLAEEAPPDDLPVHETLADPPSEESAIASDTLAEAPPDSPSSGTEIPVEDSAPASDSVIPIEESVAIEPPALAEPQVPTRQSEPDVQLEGFRSASWLLQQEPDRFTLQMVSVSSMERAVTFVERQRDPENFAIYRALRDGRELYVVTYGLYSNRAAATQAVDQLVGELADMQPWIRPLASVQESVREAMDAEPN